MSHVINEFASRTTPQTYHFRSDPPIPKELLKTIQTELKQRGAVAYDLWLPETHFLPHVLHKDEHILGSTYGKYLEGRGVLVGTDQRVLFIDKKPMFMRVDELPFAMIAGVTFTKTPLLGYITLHTRQTDYKLRTFNFKNAANFVDYIETVCLQQTYPAN